ncbi:MAG: peptidoglycan-binding protein [Leptolyngbyaceae cyanobacterium]
MDPILTPHLWVIYETSNTPPKQINLVFGWRSLRLYAAAAMLSAIALLLSSQPLQARALPSAGRVYIASDAASNVNIRSGPGTEYPVVNTLSRGTAIDISGQYQNGWAQLNNGNWVAGFLIDSQPPFRSANTVTSGTGFSAYINTPVGYNLNIRRGPGTQYRAVNTLARNTPIAVNGQVQNGWLQLTDGSWAAGNWIQVTQSFSQTPVASTPPSQSTDLRFGDRGARVSDLQRRLQTLGYLPASVVPDGVFAQNTQNAVIRFQQANGLVADGIAGPRTLGVLYGSAALGESTRPPFVSEPTPVSRGASGAAEVVTDDGGDILVFSGPGTEYDQLLPIPSGTSVVTTGQSEDGIWTRLADGGWVYSGRLRF